MTPQRSPLRPSNQDTTKRRQVPSFHSPNPLIIMSCSSSSFLDLSKASTHWHLQSSSEKLEEPWNIAGLLQVIKIFGHTTPFFQAIETKLIIDSSRRQCQASSQSQQQNAWCRCGKVHSWRRAFIVTSNWGRDVYQRCRRKEEEQLGTLRDNRIDSLKLSKDICINLHVSFSIGPWISVKWMRMDENGFWNSHTITCL